MAAQDDEAARGGRGLDGAPAEGNGRSRADLPAELEQARLEYQRLADLDGAPAGPPKEATLSDGEPLNSPEALEKWRAAERLAAVARQGRRSAEVAASAAELAAEAAEATALAAKTALDAATRAESSALKTAQASRLAASQLGVDLIEATEEAASATVDEARAKSDYHDAVERTERRTDGLN